MSQTRDDAMKQIAEAAEGQTLIGFGEKLKAMFGEKNCSFSMDPVPVHTIKSPDGGKPIMVVNVKYADGPTHVVGEMAIG